MRTLVATLLALILAAPAVAGELAGVSMPDTTTIQGQTLHLNGLGLRKKFFVKVYVAGLYLPEKETDAQKILSSDTPRYIVMDFLHKVTQKQLCDGWMEGLEDNVPNASADVRNKFDTLCQWMADVKVGDKVVFTYLPDHGTEVVVAGANKGTIEGKPFADALFSSWLGPDPGPGEAFKQDLLGG